MGQIAMMLVHAAPVPAEPLGDMFGRIVVRRVGIRRLALAAQNKATTRMDIDVACEEAAGAAERDVGFQRVVEILAGDLVQAALYARAQGIGKINLFS